MPDAPPPAHLAEEATRIFLDHRELLFSIVYAMLGGVADTEDVLQETWLAWAARWGGAEAGEIAGPRAYLVRVAVNAALARRAAVSRRRETYPGPWLPEPVIRDVPAGSTEAGTAGEDAAEPALRAEAVSMALMVVLETLAPVERAVFVLHEVFGYAHTEIAGMLGRPPAAVRQLAHRAREHVRARRPRYRPDPGARRQVTERFLAAALGGDLDALMRVLAPDVTLWTDGGGRARASLQRPVRGRAKVARLIAGITSHIPEGVEVRYRTVNGDPSAVLFDGDAPFAVMVVDLAPDGDHVTGIYTVTNPDKLTHVTSARPATEPAPDGPPPSEAPRQRKVEP
ncbi:RNA polymerase sigma factor SigJ [Nonomuraea sp. NPDC050691]|uniref:RNA polymerase sigma factor SigJ n=1 Tax=Nonomuraea sp. NPDC050691 TaxID=3155661 RepID=UPI0033D2FABE